VIRLQDVVGAKHLNVLLLTLCILICFWSPCQQVCSDNYKCTSL